MSAEIEKQLEAMMPKNLDDIIRANRHLAQLRLATDEEIMDLSAQIRPSDNIKDQMQNWRFIVLHVLPTDDVQIMLLGDKSDGRGPRITSVVRQIDLDRQLVITNSGSLYGLGKPGCGEPDMDQLIMVCIAFNGWGFGPALGVAPFFC